MLRKVERSVLFMERLRERLSDVVGRLAVRLAVSPATVCRWKSDIPLVAVCLAMGVKG
jgi:hypothetical protein